jgi:ribonucleoside-diphosphate reductase alpha chain
MKGGTLMIDELSDNAKKVFKDLYSLSNETIDGTFKRVAKEFGKEDIAYELLSNNKWRPCTPVFLNAGSKHRIFSACFVVDLIDSMNSIYDVANVARKIFQFGAGIGIPIGNLREQNADIFEGDRSQVPEGKSSGPICFMKLFDAVGESTKSGGRVRRAAILCAMSVNHPDVLDYIQCKEKDGTFANMNISVNITDDFMLALEDNVSFDLISPNTGEKVKTVDANDLWEQFVYMNWKTADPGIIFIDNMNKYNPLKSKKNIECTNPCGEQPLTGYSCCNLSAININKFITDNNEMDWKSLYDTAYTVMELSDNLIDVMEFPDERFKDNAYKYRHVGVGLMGLADAMFSMDIKYDSLKGRQFAGEIMKTITTACVHKSAELAKEKGKLFEYDDIKHDIEKIVFEFVEDEEIRNLVRTHGLRNIQHTTCAPTGTTALSCDTSYGIEPSFGLVFQKNLISGDTMYIVNQIFKERFEKEEWYTGDLLEKIFKNGGTLKNLRGIPKEVRDVFVTAHDIKPKDRINVQAALQKHCSTAISSTINLPKDTTKDEISELYKYAHKMNLKGITVYRDGCKSNQPVSFVKEDTVTPTTDEYVRPGRLSADVFRILTGNGTLYVTVSSGSDNKPVEIFISIGKSGQVMNTLTESLGRSISVALQDGVSIDKIIKTLTGLNSDKPVWTRLEETDKKPVQILSIPDGVAKLLDRYYGSGKSNGYISDKETCERCGLELIMIEGCKSCTCGYSKCS